MDYQNKEDIKNGTSVLSKELLVACIMGDADRLQFERFNKNKCNIDCLSIKEIGLSTKDGKPVRAFSCHGTFADHAVVRACILFVLIQVLIYAMFASLLAAQLQVQEVFLTISKHNQAIH